MLIAKRGIKYGGKLTKEKIILFYAVGITNSMACFQDRWSVVFLP